MKTKTVKKSKSSSVEGKVPATKAKIKTKKSKLESLSTSVDSEQKEVEDSISALENDDRAHARELARMFKYLKKLRFKLQRDCLTGSGNRSIYALCHVLSQQREVISDIRSITDLSGQVTMLDQTVLQPLVRSLGQHVLNIHYQLRKLITEISDKRQTQFGLEQVDNITKDFSGLLQLQYDQAMSQTTKMFMGE